MQWVEDFVARAPADAVRSPTHRPGNPRGLQPRVALSGISAQQIPRIIVQSVANRQDGQWMGKYRRLMDSWRLLNPEYLHLLLNDDDCTDFVTKQMPLHEQLAYHTVVTGAQRADLFRVYFLRSVGGIWADIDTEIRTPLRNFIPANASAVVSVEWDFSFLAYAPNHPVMEVMSKRATEETLYQAATYHVHNPWGCKSPMECVLAVTGPLMYDRAVISAARSAGCFDSGWKPRPARGDGTADCGAAGNLMRDVHVCDDPNWRSPFCGAVMHWDCSNSAARRDCGKSHYKSGKAFFRAPPDKLTSPNLAWGRPSDGSRFKANQANLTSIVPRRLIRERSAQMNARRGSPDHAAGPTAPAADGLSAADGDLHPMSEWWRRTARARSRRQERQPDETARERERWPREGPRW